MNPKTATLTLPDRQIHVNAVCLSGEEAIALLWELNKRIGERDSPVYQKGAEAMMIEALKVKVANVFATMHRNAKTEITRKVIVGIENLVLSRINSIKGQLEGLFEQSRYDESVDFLVAFSRGNVKIAVPWYLRWLAPSTDKVIDELGVWLKANRELFKEKIGDGNPMAVN